MASFAAKKRAKKTQTGVPQLNQYSVNLQHMMFYACVAGVAIVFIALIHSIIVYRRSHRTGAHDFYHSLKAEIVWAVLPLIIFVGVALPSARDIVSNGKPDAAMLDSAETAPNAEIAAITTYERNAWDNDTGDAVTADADAAAQ